MPAKKYIGIVGTRKATYEMLKNPLRQYFDRFIRDYGRENIVIVSGGAKGTDTIAIIMAKSRGLQTLEILPKYSEYKTKYNKIYYERNQRIVDRVSKLLAFPYKRSGGTMLTVRLWEQKPDREYNSLTVYNFNIIQ
jgi:predicted Rossmann fold nucleotide-binding protein DprA/Smf involved in DNA uptake